MKKVGIVTRYYESCNYGGLLQAYALCRYLRSLGYDAEQICCDREREREKYTLKTIWKLPPDQIIQKLKNAIYGKVVKIMTRLVVKKYNDRRFQATRIFRDGIPHSEGVYNKKTVRDCKDHYDIFVTGSDRVWSVNHIDSPMFLGFAKDKPKYSYAASLMAKTMTEKQKSELTACLSTYSGISVRERETCALLAPIEAEWVVDPTLLLYATQWDEVADERFVEEKYLFCYFLGNDCRNRRVAKIFARKYNLKIVTMPYVEGRFNFADIRFGDIRLFDVTPGQFISLIKHAEYIFTDSFHGSVFSSIYNKEFFSFYRKNKQNSSTRLESLTAMLGVENHLCDTKKKVSLYYIENTEPIDYSAVADKLEDMRAKSKVFLDRLSSVQ